MRTNRRKEPASSALAQVAEKANVSTGTVSRVFNNSPLIPPETRIKVLAVARELGIRPRIGVRSKQIALVTQPPHKAYIGGYVNTLTHYLCYELSRADASIVMVTEDRIDSLAHSWIDGIIGIAWEEPIIDLLKELKNIPVIWFSDMHKEFFHTIFVDAWKTGRMAGEYLFRHGHRKIAVIHEDDYTGNKRADGLASVFAANGLRQEEFLLRYPNSQPLYQTVQNIVDSGCSAIWVTGEDLKIFEVNWLLQSMAKKRVPEDISLLGFENPGISKFQSPPLTTIESPLFEMAEQAVKMVLRDDFAGLELVELSSRLIERGSVKTI